MRLASARNTRPAGVTLTARPLRSSSDTPTSCSSSMICLLSGGWVRCSRAAARPKCSSSATTTNALIRSMLGS